MTPYYAGGIKLEFPGNLFEPMDRATVEHVIRCYLEEDKLFQGATPADQNRDSDRSRSDLGFSV